MDGKEDKFDKFDEMGQLHGGFDVNLAREKALEHAFEKLSKEKDWLQGMELEWEIADARFDEDADCYRVVLECYPEGIEVEEKAQWEYHIDALGNLYAGTPRLVTRGKWNKSAQLEQKSKYCAYCGQTNTISATFCNSCGKELPSKEEEEERIRRDEQAERAAAAHHIAQFAKEQEIREQREEAERKQIEEEKQKVREEAERKRTEEEKQRRDEQKKATPLSIKNELRMKRKALPIVVGIIAFVFAVIIVGIVMLAGGSDDGQEISGIDITDTSTSNNDDDNDGFTENQGDCNDDDASINPNTPEICGDGIDQNCDGSDLICPNNPSDDVDDDNDGYTENQGDCNDDDASINPNTPDICGDGIDQDCSGSDRSCDDVDDDDDGFTENGGDCDDSDASVNPNASEIYGDSIDQDCNGSAETLVISNEGSVESNWKSGGNAVVTDDIENTKVPQVELAPPTFLTPPEQEPVRVLLEATAVSYDPIVRWEWDFGDGFSKAGEDVPRVFHDYTHEGDYTVSVKVYDSEGRSDVSTLTGMFEKPHADFAAKTVKCNEPLTVEFTDLSTSMGMLLSWEWDFDGNGIVDSTDTNPTYTFPESGFYDVNLTVEGTLGQPATVSKLVSAGAPPVADFTAFAEINEAQLTVHFNDLSVPGDEATPLALWLWDFGDGNTNSEQHTMHKYNGTGPYTVSLTVTESDGNCDTVTKTIKVPNL